MDRSITEKEWVKIELKLLWFHFHRLIEEFQLEGTLKSHLVHPAWNGQGHLQLDQVAPLRTNLYHFSWNTVGIFPINEVKANKVLYYKKKSYQNLKRRYKICIWDKPSQNKNKSTFLESELSKLFYFHMWINYETDFLE